MMAVLHRCIPYQALRHVDPVEGTYRDGRHVGYGCACGGASDGACDGAGVH